MKLFQQIALGLTALAFLASCQQPASNTPATNTPAAPTPKKLMVDLPASLTPTSAPAAAANMGPARVVSSGSGYQSGSSGYFVLYTSIGMVKQIVQMMALYGIVVDAVVQQNNLTPSSTSHAGLSVTITQALIDQMKTAVPAAMLAGATYPPLGAMAMPDIVYNTSANANFAYSLSFIPPGSTSPMTFFWNADKSKFGMQQTSSGTTFTIANDTNSQSTFMGIGSSTMTYAVKFKADSAATGVHGVFVSLTAAVTGSPSGTVTGYGDDNGGAVNYAMTMSGTSYVYTENFNATGGITYQASTVGMTAAPPTVGTTPSATYTTKLANTDFGSAPTLFP